jgi:rRNA-processing protein CGR1
LERKKLREEQERMEALAAKMSAKRLERLKKREARKKARV